MGGVLLGGATNRAGVVASKLSDGQLRLEQLARQRMHG